MLDELIVRRDALQFAGHFAQRHLLDLAVDDAHHVAVLVLEDEVGGLRAQAGGKHAVVRAGAAAALHVARHGDADLDAGLLGDLLGDLVGDGGVLVIALLFLEVLLGKGGVLLGDGALGHGEDGEALALLGAVLDGFDDPVDVVGDLGDEDDVRAAGDARVQRQPADLVAHDLDDEDTVVRGGGGVDVVDSFGGDVHGALEAEGHVGAVDVVVDGLGQVDDVEALFAQEVGRLLRAVAAEDDQTVQTQLVVVLLHGLDLVQTLFVRHAHHLEGLAGGAQYGAALGEDAGKVARGQHAVVAIDQALVAVHEAVDLKLGEVVAQALHHAAHGGVERLAIAAAGQKSDPFHSGSRSSQDVPVGYSTFFNTSIIRETNVFRNK